VADDELKVSVNRVIAAPPEVIFAVLDNPAKHPLIDGSGTVKASRAGDGDRHLTLGDRFGMDMKIVVPYRMQNTVVEYEKDRLIAWQHFGKHRWRYELEPVEGGTRVTETFDWSTALSAKFIELMKYPSKHVPAMERTLERLDELVTGGA